MDTLTSPRLLDTIVTGRPTSDGAGVRLVRLLDGPLQQRLDPFLMLDAFGSDEAADYIAGFPDHPHRGFETVTYMIAGRMRHRDSAGHEGLLENGGVQWMTAGRGVIHSELPEQEEGRMEGFQLWLNLPGRDKLCPPWYRDFSDAQIPEWQASGVRVRVIAGQHQGVQGAVQREATQVLYLDVHLAPGASHAVAIPAAHNAFVHVYRGEAALGGGRLVAGQMGLLANQAGSDGVQLSNPGVQPARLLVLAGQPLGEPIVQYGPFVMNTPQQIHEAIADFRAGRLA
ncbi:pirin family protein [Ideonella sp. 4Y16]|uniref:pirin family protein n=1 Tax=Ideonella alba TaxID=2824118 RepID=UPI001B367513|nr:pirin family protein [Ideonella alba]MBQ0945691.1 pirin family protein [Ideonella alba]